MMTLLKDFNNFCETNRGMGKIYKIEEFNALTSKLSGLTLVEITRENFCPTDKFFVINPKDGTISSFNDINKYIENNVPEFFNRTAREKVSAPLLEVDPQKMIRFVKNLDLMEFVTLLGLLNVADENLPLVLPMSVIHSCVHEAKRTGRSAKQSLNFCSDDPFFLYNMKTGYIYSLNKNNYVETFKAFYAKTALKILNSFLKQ